MWKDNDKIIKVYGKANEGKIKFPCLCPICQNTSAHVYIHRHNEDHCGIWTWCSTCKASAHMSGRTPIWWVNPDFVDSSKLCSDPMYLNSISNKIDEWVNPLLPTITLEDNDQFVMENKFDVVLKEKINGIAAGSTGVIVIRDDFKTVKVDFITSDGKTVHMNEELEKIEQSVEVISNT